MFRVSWNSGDMATRLRRGFMPATGATATRGRPPATAGTSLRAALEHDMHYADQQAKGYRARADACEAALAKAPRTRRKSE